MLAVHHAAGSTAKVLLEYGADVNAKDKNGDTVFDILQYSPYINTGDPDRDDMWILNLLNKYK